MAFFLDRLPLYLNLFFFCWIIGYFYNRFGKTEEKVKVDDDMKNRFKQYWTVEFDNYPVYDHYLKVPEAIAIKAGV